MGTALVIIGTCAALIGGTAALSSSDDVDLAKTFRGVCLILLMVGLFMMVAGSLAR